MCEQLCSLDLELTRKWVHELEVQLSLLHLPRLLLLLLLQLLPQPNKHTLFFQAGSSSVTMALSEVAAMGTSIIAAAQSVKTHGENWYKMSSAWEKFPGQVTDLRQKHASLVSILTRSGMVFENADTTLLDQMSVLSQQLDMEENRLDRMSGGCLSCCFPRLTGFPNKIGNGMQNVIDGFDKILQRFDHLRSLSIRIMSMRRSNFDDPHAKQ